MPGKPAVRSAMSLRRFCQRVSKSPTLGGHIALAFLKSGRERYGEKIVVWDKLRGVETAAEVCDPVFVDPENRKLMA